MIDKMPIFYEWLNEITEETEEKADSLKMSAWEAAGIRDDAPDHVKKAFKEYVKEEAYWRGNRTTPRPFPRT